MFFYFFVFFPVGIRTEPLYFKTSPLEDVALIKAVQTLMFNCITQ